MKRAYGVLALVLLLVVGFRVVSLVMGQKDDATLIRESLRQSLEASRKGEPGGVLETISNSLKVNGEDRGGNSGMIANYVRNQKPDIEVVNQNPIVTGDEARITSTVNLKVSVPGLGEQVVPIKDVVLTFRKETGREYLVFPVKRWRLSEVTAPPVALDALGIQ